MGKLFNIRGDILDEYKMSFKFYVSFTTVLVAIYMAYQYVFGSNAVLVLISAPLLTVSFMPFGLLIEEMRKVKVFNMVSTIMLSRYLDVLTTYYAIMYCGAIEHASVSNTIISFPAVFVIFQTLVGLLFGYLVTVLYSYKVSYGERNPLLKITVNIGMITVILLLWYPPVNNVFLVLVHYLSTKL
ncbi:hypothetical protein [Thermofilum sp.]|jgi:hypothetical protein|uniref:hypothetical protein n=1 Tax=Thermofilum sp. TaxID=1961369 RepID=UPI002583B952|nr:hypothetical protein [Thermofilum sp.]